MTTSWVMGLLVGMVYFLIGGFLSLLVVPAVIVKAILGGSKGIRGLFKRRLHNQLPKVAEMKFQHDFVRTKSGTKFHYVHTGSEDSPLMLCLHGFPECWYSWRHILEKFSAKFHVVALDMRGYGESDKPSSIGEYHIDYLVNDVREVIIGLGYEKAVIVGHDWGGVIAWEIPLFYPEVVNKLIIMSAPSRKAFMEYLMGNVLQVLSSWYIFFFQIPFLPEFVFAANDYQFFEEFMNQGENKLSSDEVEIYKNSVARFLNYGINYYRACNPMYKGLKMKRVTKQIVQPTLLLWGKKDKAISHKCIDYIQKYLPQLSVGFLEEASHWMVHESPDEVCLFMENFLERDDAVSS